MQNAYTWMLMILRKAHISTNTCLHQGFGSIARAYRITTAGAPQVATAQWTHGRLKVVKQPVGAKAGAAGVPIYCHKPHAHS